MLKSLPVTILLLNFRKKFEKPNWSKNPEFGLLDTILEQRPYSFQMYQIYISRISEESPQERLVELNKIAVNEGLEDIKKLRQYSTVVETDIHYPTNNSLIWDCIKTSYDLLEKLSKELPQTNYRNYIKTAKRTYYKINNTKGKRKEAKAGQLFKKQLITFTKTINNLSNAVKKIRLRH